MARRPALVVAAMSLVLASAGCSDDADPASPERTTTTDRVAVTTVEKGQRVTSRVVEDPVQGSPIVEGSDFWQVLVDIDPPYGVVSTRRVRLGFAPDQFRCDDGEGAPDRLHPRDTLAFTRHPEGEIAASLPPLIGGVDVVAQCSGPATPSGG